MPSKSFALALTSALLLSNALAAPLFGKRQGTSAACSTSCQSAITGISNCAPTGASESNVIDCICNNPTIIGDANSCYNDCQDYISSLTGGDQINQGLGSITQGCAALQSLGTTTDAPLSTTSGSTGPVVPSAASSGDGSRLPVWLPAGDSVFASEYTAGSLGGISTTVSAEIVTAVTNAAGATVTASFEEYIAAGPGGDRILDIKDADNFIIEDCIKIDEATGDCVLVQIQGGSTAFATHFTATGAETLVAFVTGAPEASASAVVPSESAPVLSASGSGTAPTSSPALPLRR